MNSIMDILQSNAHHLPLKNQQSPQGCITRKHTLAEPEHTPTLWGPYLPARWISHSLTGICPYKSTIHWWLQYLLACTSHPLWAPTSPNSPSTSGTLHSNCHCFFRIPPLSILTKCTQNSSERARLSPIPPSSIPRNADKEQRSRPAGLIRVSQKEMITPL